MGLSPTPVATFPQAPLRSRTARFPRSGSDLGLSLRRLPTRSETLRLTPNTPRNQLVCDETRSPLRIGNSWLKVQDRSGTAKCPEFLRPPPVLPATGRCPHLLDGRYPTVLATTHSCASPVPSHRLGLYALCGRSLQLTVSPCWEQHLPDVISANPSSDAWTPTPVVPTVHMLVSSRRASAFPELKAGRHSTTFRTATSVRGSLRGCSHSLMFRPPSLLALQIAPTAEVLTPSGQPGLFHSSNTRLVTSSCVEYANRSNRATNGARTCTSQNSQPCRLLL